MSVAIPDPSIDDVDLSVSQRLAAAYALMQDLTGFARCEYTASGGALAFDGQGYRKLPQWLASHMTGERLGICWLPIAGDSYRLKRQRQAGIVHSAEHS